MSSETISNQSVDLSPEYWPLEVRERVEAQESQSWLAAQSRSVSGQDSLVCATCSPIALQAGLAALKHGGTAADATAAIALTQIANQLGSVVSYAGIMSCIYFTKRTIENAQPLHSEDSKPARNPV